MTSRFSKPTMVSAPRPPDRRTVDHPQIRVQGQSVVNRLRRSSVSNDGVGVEVRRTTLLDGGHLKHVADRRFELVSAERR